MKKETYGKISLDVSMECGIEKANDNLNDYNILKAIFETEDGIVTVDVHNGSVDWEKEYED